MAEEGMNLRGFLEPDIPHSSPNGHHHHQHNHQQYSSYFQNHHPRPSFQLPLVRPSQSPPHHPYYYYDDYFTSSGSSQSLLFQPPRLLLDDLIDENNIGLGQFPAPDIFTSKAPDDVVVGLYCCSSSNNVNSAAADPNAVPVVRSRDLKLRSSNNWDGDAAANYNNNNNNIMMYVDIEDEVAFARSCLAVLLDDDHYDAAPPPPANNYNAADDGSKLMLVGPPSPSPSPSSPHHTTTTTTVQCLISNATGEIGRGRDWCFGPAMPSSESVRRRQITRLFCSLRALFPSPLIPKLQQQQLNDKCKLIDYTCQYIRELENKLVKLKRKIKILKRMNSSKLHRLQHQSQSSSLDQVQIAHMQVASSCGGKVVNISLGCYGTTLSFSTLLRILDMRGLDVLSANCSLSCNTALYAIHSKVKDSTSSFSSMDIEKLQAELKFKTR